MAPCARLHFPFCAQAQIRPTQTAMRAAPAPTNSFSLEINAIQQSCVWIGPQNCDSKVQLMRTPMHTGVQIISALIDGKPCAQVHGKQDQPLCLPPQQEVSIVLCVRKCRSGPEPHEVVFHAILAEPPVTVCELRSRGK